MNGDEDGLTLRALVMELREDVRLLRSAVVDMAADQQRLADSIKREQELGTERRAAMRRTADAFAARLDDHGQRIDTLEKRNDRQDGAAIFAKAAFGTSAIALLAVVLQIVEQVSPR